MNILDEQLKQETGIGLSRDRRPILWYIGQADRKLEGVSKPVFGNIVHATPIYSNFRLRLQHHILTQRTLSYYTQSETLAIGLQKTWRKS